MNTKFQTMQESPIQQSFIFQLPTEIMTVQQFTQFHPQPSITDFSIASTSTAYTAAYPTRIADINFTPKF